MPVNKVCTEKAKERKNMQERASQLKLTLNLFIIFLMETFKVKDVCFIMKSEQIGKYFSAAKTNKKKIYIYSITY